MHRVLRAGGVAGRVRSAVRPPLTAGTEEDRQGSLGLSHRNQQGLDRNSLGSTEEGTPDLRRVSVSPNMAE